MIKAVIFDLDGTLIDTEKHFRVAWPMAFSHFGYTMSDEDYLSIRSLGNPFVQHKLKSISGDENFDYEKVREYRSQLMKERLNTYGIETKKGAKELLSYLESKSIIRAVATASPEARASRYLEQVELLPFFTNIISARDMKEGKPSPDVYAYAVKTLGLRPEECLAVEDSPNGALSAYRAGLKVIMVPDQAPTDEETSKIVFKEVSDLSKIIEVVEQLTD